MKKISRVVIFTLCLSLFGVVGLSAVAASDVDVNIALPNNPICAALAKIANEKYSAPGVKVNIAVLPENDLRQKLTTEASMGGTTYDIYVIGPYEANTWAKNGWLKI